jgi:hypothetical protein
MNIERLKILKKTLIAVGLLIIVISCFMPFTTSCKQGNGPEEFIVTTQYGFDSLIFYSSILFLFFIVTPSFFGHSNYAYLTIMIIFGGVFVLFFRLVSEPGWGKPFGYSPTQFQNILFLGELLIILGGYINIYISNKEMDS